MGTAPPSAKVIVESTAEAATDSVANLFKSIVCEAVDTRGGAHVALAGGTTPHMLYQRLGRSGMRGDLPWSKMEIFFGDERDVPQDHVESNFRMVQRTLLDHVPINWAKVHPMRADAGDIDAAAKEYEQGFLLAEVPFGDGFLDMKRIAAVIRKARPRTRMTLEMITRDPLRVPCLTEKYWATFPNRNGRYLARTLAMVRSHPPPQPLPGMEGLDHAARLRRERNNVERCLRYAVEVMGL
mgnify:CR=1 FL=1